MPLAYAKVQYSRTYRVGPGLTRAVSLSVEEFLRSKLDIGHETNGYGSPAGDGTNKRETDAGLCGTCPAVRG